MQLAMKLPNLSMSPHSDSNATAAWENEGAGIRSVRELLFKSATAQNGPSKTRLNHHRHWPTCSKHSVN